MRLSGSPPFKGENLNQITRELQNKDIVYDDALDPDVRDLLTGMLDRNPKTRFDIDQVVHHRALQSNLSAFTSPLSSDQYGIMIRNFLINSPTGLTSDAPQEVLKFTGFEDDNDDDWINLQDEFRNTGYILNKEKQTTFQVGFVSPQQSKDGLVNQIANDFKPVFVDNVISISDRNEQIIKSFKKQPKNPEKKVIKIDNGADAWIETMHNDAVAKGLVKGTPIGPTKVSSDIDMFKSPINSFVVKSDSSPKQVLTPDDFRSAIQFSQTSKQHTMNTPESKTTVISIDDFQNATRSPVNPTRAKSQGKTMVNRFEVPELSQTVSVPAHPLRVEPSSLVDSPKSREYSKSTLGVKVVKRLYPPMSGFDDTPQSGVDSFKQILSDKRSEIAIKELSVEPDPNYQAWQTKNVDTNIKTHSINNESITSLGVRTNNVQSMPSSATSRVIVNKSNDPFRNNESNVLVRMTPQEGLASQVSKEEMYIKVNQDNGADTNGLEARRMTGKTFKINLSMYGQTASHNEPHKHLSPVFPPFIPPPETLEVNWNNSNLVKMNETATSTVRILESNPPKESDKTTVKYFKIA